LKNAIDLKGQHVFVTGAGGAIGGAAARACAVLGAKLSVADLHAPEELARELRAGGSDVKAYALDNSIRKDVESAIAQAGELDALCDCSGYYVKGDWVAGEDEWETLYRKTMDVNVLGPFNLVRAVIPGMVKRGYGRIALTTSMAARNAGSTLSVEPAYAASKGALQTAVRAPGGRQRGRRQCDLARADPDPLAVVEQTAVRDRQLSHEASGSARGNRLAVGLPVYRRHRFHDRLGDRRKRRHGFFLRSCPVLCPRGGDARCRYFRD
jgi:NAD(P)-dependent dehydrogenase (short-subunit alcohol dehydrogenase family)